MWQAWKALILVHGPHHIMSQILYLWQKYPKNSSMSEIWRTCVTRTDFKDYECKENTWTGDGFDKPRFQRV